jgi:hypothetical protein
MPSLPVIERKKPHIKATVTLKRSNMSCEINSGSRMYWPRISRVERLFKEYLSVTMSNAIPNVDAYS